MIRLKQNISGYLFIEALVRSWPRKKQLPEWLWGYIPSIGKHEARELPKYGIYEVDNKREKRYNGGI